ncbi:MAG TPA: serine/threonine-protein kinase, partial [Planctomycetota bacterium]|nr:serine/threonine-protein kinase [Planctomycetota bacterium]
MADGPADPDNLRALAELPDALEQEVLAALELEADKRDAALTDIAASNPQHAGLLRAWVAAAMADDAPPSQPPARVPPADAPPPSAIGPYRLLHVLGRGGFGTVWLAEQDQPIRRQVAIKVVNPGMDSREVLARFHGEREALNRMDHPGIARLIDAGATSDGQPYFVMEYVPGVMLRTHCRSASIDVTQRLQLFLCVLDAVQHAHMKAVIHRDLSSNNVLVTEIDGRWQPKIIDFGVAKSLAVPLQESGGLTFHGTLMGTPEFMSPEQAKGLGDIDTRADVYALGVQLYELLTDQLPIPSTVLRAEGVAGMARVVSTFVPAVPSCIAPAPHRAALRGDLDLIVLRALAKDRNERYATAAELAADLRRYLAHQPVHAARPGRWYVLRKFARRNRLPFAAALLLAAGLLAALGVSLHFLHEAGQARIDAEQARQRSDARADAGFKLLANIDRLQAAEQRERELGPPWPDQLPAMRDWLSRLAEPLVKQLP